MSSPRALLLQDLVIKSGLLEAGEEFSFGEIEDGEQDHDSGGENTSEKFMGFGQFVDEDENIDETENDDIDKDGTGARGAENNDEYPLLKW